MIPRSISAVLLSLITLTVTASPQNETSTWQKTVWHDEPAWVAKSGDQEAIVSENRSRVIYLGSVDGAFNLLSAPFPKAEPTKEIVSPNWGGHRFWLGPQSRWGWPPVKDWEFSASVSADAQDGVLSLKQVHENPNYPAIERTYEWEGSRLRCTARWQGQGHPYYGMHVVAIDTPAEISPRLSIWENVPQGVVGVRGDKPNVVDPLPHAGVKVSEGQAHLETGIGTVKLGFFPQTLSVRRGAWTLLVHNGPIQGIPIESPDFGYLSQVWVGDSHYNYCELEQITPFLLAGPDGWCGSTIYLQAKKG